MDSIWTKTSLPQFEKLQKDIKVDVLVIGGGMAGLLCAYFLKQSRIRYALVEADRICSRITKNTTAKITLQHGLIYHKLIEKFGIEKAQMYLEANKEALTEYQKLCKEIDCDFQQQDAFVYSLDDKAVLEKELEALIRLGYQADLVKNISLPFSVAGSIRVQQQAQFHPLKFISKLIQGLQIYENTRVKELSKHMATTEHATITANKIIVATHFPIINKHGSYFLKMYQHRSYVLALENTPNFQGMYIDGAENGLSFRNYDNMLLLGGGGHRTGKNGGNWSVLEQFAAKYLPDSHEVCRWATQDCMTLDGIPYIGQYSKRTPDFYVATGFNKWGMTSSMAAAKILTDMVMGKNTPYAEVFSPSRSILHPQLLINAYEAMVNLLTISDKRCPHMGCALKWNPQEQSWDCPCHGSRFTHQGKLIDNPSTGDLNRK